MEGTGIAGQNPFSGMSDPALRSEASLAFEKAWNEASSARDFPLRRDIGLKSFARFAPMMAIIEPDMDKPSLPFRLAGSGFFDFFGTDLTGVDYLSLVDPAISQDAYDCVRALMARPCGLWQFTPVLDISGSRRDYEYTIFPIAKEAPENGDGAADHILIYVHSELTPADAMPDVQRLEGATVWRWIDTGHGIPPVAAPFF